jgi:hypothetical protein
VLARVRVWGRGNAWMDQARVQGTHASLVCCHRGPHSYLTAACVNVCTQQSPFPVVLTEIIMHGPCHGACPAWHAAS